MTPREFERYGRLAVLLVIAISRAGTSAGSDEPTAGQASRAEVHYYAIVGAVHAPATYSSEQRRALLRDVVDRAGGLTQAASGGFRLVHRDRQTQVFIAPRDLPEAALSVPSGAVIVVESSQTGADAPRRDEMIHVACRQLLERPVVLGGTAARLTLPQLLSALGQSRLDPQSVDVLPRTVRLGRETVIPTGTVLSFDPSLLDQVALQQVLQRSPLQDVIPLTEAPIERQPDLPVVRHRHIPPPPRESSPETVDADIPAIAPAPPAEPETGIRLVSVAVTEPAAAPEQVVALTPVPANDQNQVSDAPVPRQSVKTDNVATDNAAVFRSDDVENNEQIQQMAGPRETRRTRNSKSDAAAAGPVVAVPEVVTPPAPARRARSGIDSQQVLYAAAATACLALLAVVGAVVWSRRERRRLRTHRKELRRGLAASPLPADPPERHVLDLLINDELPVVMEEVVFPEGMEFHGRAVGFRYLVHHEPQSLGGPHYAQSQSRVKAARESHRAAVGTTSGASGSGPAPPDRPAAATSRRVRASSSPVSPLERALRAQQRGASQ